MNLPQIAVILPAAGRSVRYGTLTVMVVLAVAPPLVPVIVSVYALRGVFLPIATVSVDDPDPIVSEFELNGAVD